MNKMDPHQIRQIALHAKELGNNKHRTAANIIIDTQNNFDSTKTQQIYDCLKNELLPFSNPDLFENWVPCKYYIVNEFDRPCEELVAASTDGKTLHYVHPSVYHHNVMDMRKDSVNVLKFGFVIETNFDEGCVRFKKVQASTAEYIHGGQRNWQGIDEFCLPIYGSSFYATHAPEHAV